MKLPESLRDNLLALGIPEELHTLEGLAAFFPPEFRMDGMELDAVVLAGMLLRFAESGLIQPQARIPSESLPPGIHACQFYITAGELMDFVAPYFRRGLADELLCVWVVSPPLTRESAAAALKARIPGWDARMARGQMEILHQDDCYTFPSGEMRSADGIIKGFEAKGQEALDRGFRGMRAVGDTTWCARLADAEPYLAYERRVSRMLKGKKITGLCTYALPLLPEALLGAVLGAHKESYVKTGLSWEGFRDFREARTRLSARLKELRAA